jgi:gliding motility-associated-like protein
LLLPALLFSQIDVVNDGLPTINNDLDVVINGNLVHQGNGNITNTGNFYITGNLINNNPANNVFTSGSNGWVHVIGDTQTIGGTTMTHFNNLELTGTGVKQLVGADVEIEDSLILNDREFASTDNTVFVTDPGLGIIRYQPNGFVSSTNDGGLSRNTLSASTYTFPVGSNLGTMRYRPVDITPNSAASNTYKVRMANVDATTEGFPLTSKEGAVGDINPNFYHRINRTFGSSPADITIYYDNTLDGNYTVQAQWQNTSLWKSLGAASTSSNYGFTGLTTSGFNNFSPTPFALSTELTLNVFVANVFSPNGDGFNDVLHLKGKGISQFLFTIYDRWGEKVFETTDISIGWDGNFKGKPMDPGVFVYYVTGKLENGDAINKKGNVTLLR